MSQGLNFNQNMTKIQKLTFGEVHLKTSFAKQPFCLVHNVLSQLLIGSGLNGIAGLVQEKRHSIANAPELRISCVTHQYLAAIFFMQSFNKKIICHPLKQQYMIIVLTI